MRKTEAAHSLQTLLQALADNHLPELPYDPYRDQLYSTEELLEPEAVRARFEAGDDDSYAKTLDARVYAHWIATDKSQPSEVLESLARALHDHGVYQALNRLLEGRQVAAIMGGHSLPRFSRMYYKAALLSRNLTREGFFLASGGGPGAMEATHLGAWFVDRTDEELDNAIEILARAPSYRDTRGWLMTAAEVRRTYPPPDRERARSLGVPTWLFGHEPPTMFATDIAKFFANSIREDGLVTIAHFGLVFAPGSAGTIQEIFQDNTQNYYETVPPPSPMIFLGDEYWKWRRPVFPLICSLASGKPYEHHIHITDEVDEIVELIKEHRRQRLAYSE